MTILLRRTLEWSYVVIRRLIDYLHIQPVDNRVDPTRVGPQIRRSTSLTPPRRRHPDPIQSRCIESKRDHIGSSPRSRRVPLCCLVLPFVFISSNPKPDNQEKRTVTSFVRCNISGCNSRPLCKTSTTPVPFLPHFLTLTSKLSGVLPLFYSIWIFYQVTI